MDRLREECGLFGVSDSQEAAKLTYLGLYALQHRGQDGCGIVSCFREKPEEFFEHKAFGLVGDVFHENTLAPLKGDMAIGHVRYTTQGGSFQSNIQPFFFHSHRFGNISFAHNGNITNADELREQLEAQGSIFSTNSDSEIFMHLLARSQEESFREAVLSLANKVKGAYSLVLLQNGRLYGFRDASGFRPLVLGRKQDSFVLASETCALDLIDAQYVRDIQEGELVEINTFVQSYRIRDSSVKPSFCSFEPIYFSRPDSLQNKKTVYSHRKRIGEVLASEDEGVEADVVVAVPDSGVPMAIGYANATKIPLDLGLIRNHYVGRTFIEPTQSIRDFGVKLKLNRVLDTIADKRVVVVDDSIVRGTTCRKIIRMIREAGAKEIHVRVGSPVITHSCFYGVATPKRSKLLGANCNVEQMRDLLYADSVKFISLEGLKEALGENQEAQHCYACFTGNYPEGTR